MPSGAALTAVGSQRPWGERLGGGEYEVLLESQDSAQIEPAPLPAVGPRRE